MIEPITPCCGRKSTLIVSPVAVLVTACFSLSADTGFRGWASAAEVVSALAEIPIPLDREELFDGCVPALQRAFEVVFSTSHKDFPSRAASRIDASSCSASPTNDLLLISFCKLVMLILRPSCQGDLNESIPT
jgi:hypothetical protein